MSTRVLATEDAQNAINQIQQILNGGLQETIANLKQYGTTLSEPNVWDGLLAIEFRTSIWPSCTQSLDSTQNQLNELHQKLNSIQQNIMAAGGNA